MEETKLPFFTCPCCGAETRNPMDVESRYCGRCHWWTGDVSLGPPHLNAFCEERAEATRQVIAKILGGAQ